ISATARAYLPRVDYASPMLRGVAAREAEYLSDKERQELENQARRLDANIIHVRSPDDGPTAHLLRLALRFARNGEYVKLSRRSPERVRYTRSSLKLIASQHS